MKKLSLWLVALGLATGSAAFAQQPAFSPDHTNTQALQRIAKSAEAKYRANREKALELAEKYGWVIERIGKDGRVISLQGLDATGQPVYYITYNNSSAAATTRTDQLWSGGTLDLSLNGSSSSVANKLALWDGGRVLASHQELTGRVDQRDNPTQTSEHSTHVAGTMIATGLNPLARGMAFGYKSLLAYDFNKDGAEMATAAKDLLLSNHSYGSLAGWHFNSDRKGTDEDPYWEWWGNTSISKNEDYTFGYYNDEAANWDDIAFNAPYYLIVKSAGNNRGETGPAVGKPYYQRTSNGKFELVKSRPQTLSSNDAYDVITTTGTAKNILTVGAVKAIADGYNQTQDVVMTGFSSWGPTDDGRIKPDLVGDGQEVLSTSSANDRSYQVQSGTSMAAPNVSGTLLLLQEHFSGLNQGRFMRAATLKGLVIHTADEAGDAPGPDYRYGWGLLNAERAATLISNSDQTHLLQEKTLAQNEEQTIEVTASGKGPLRITISWTDPKGKVTAEGANPLNNRSPRLVNDLDLRVAGNGKSYLPWALDPAAPAEAAKPGDNVVDNVEQVLIADAVPGTKYTIKVKHKGTLQEGPQAYTLLVSGAGGTAVCASAPTSSQGTRVSKFSFGGKSMTLADDCSTYRNLMTNIFAVEPSQAIPLQLELGSCGTATASVAKVYIDWNGNGSFGDAGEAVATSGAVSGNFAATVKAPDNLTAGDKVRMRVVVQETADAAAVSACGSYARGETQDYLLQFIKPQRDIALESIQPAGGSALCANPAQKVVVTLRNSGTSAQQNIPVAVKVLKNGQEQQTLTGTFAGTLPPFGQAELVLEEPFATEAGATYELLATSELTGDAVAGNNQRSYTFAVAAGNEPPADAAAFRCSDSPVYTLSAEGGGAPYWYTSLSGTTPIAAGNQAQVTADKAGSTLFAAFNDFSATVGPKDKNVFAGGGYNQFTPDVQITTSAPMVLEQARLYIGHSGKITFTVYDTNGAPVSSRTLPVTATRTEPGEGVQPDDPNDEGQVYYLGLQLPQAGMYNIAISYEGGATIYRDNENVKGYPFGVDQVFTISGNTASAEWAGYYYYFYDLKVRALGCPSPRVAVALKEGVPLEQPRITREGKELVSSLPEGNQWYLDGLPLEGADARRFTPTLNGQYSVMAFKNGCVSQMSLAYRYEVESATRDVGPELVVFPNPSGDGKFNYTVETTAPEDLTLTVVDMLGNLLHTASVRQINGQYKGMIDLSGRANGLYLVRLQHGAKVYTRKVMIRK
ncbi:S8 family serine peptidase [Pontibacter mangrovi]|uniref:T9SS type A sorting domain-containing protein n=1 Tax=Pontibacter mangrovi TaxID=2589816 RepID=A0A501VZB3_9BACT|nr:S8 family serine peptidase [Pontibacter mangrovi]TPE40281.1 T9SS type A sorting domain-containing protein [Pontibacter mangrovi]